MADAQFIRTGRWGSIVEVYTDNEELARQTALEMTKVLFAQLGRKGEYKVVKTGPLESAPLEVDHGFRIELGKA